MSKQAVPASVAQRIIIKFLAKEGVKSSEILTKLLAQFGEETLSKTQVYEWSRKFKEGREKVENESHHSPHNHFFFWDWRGILLVDFFMNVVL